MHYVPGSPANRARRGRLNASIAPGRNARGGVKLSRDDYWSLLQTLVALEASLSRKFDGLDAGLSAILLGDIALAAFFGAITVKDESGRILSFPLVFLVLLILPVAAASVGIARYRPLPEAPDVTWLINRTEIVDRTLGTPEANFPSIIEKARQRYVENREAAAVKDEVFLAALYLTLILIAGFAVTWGFLAGPIHAILKGL